MKLAPIVLFVYNRLWHTQQTISALRQNYLASDSELIIYSDAAINVNGENKVGEVRDYLKSITGFKSIEIVEREKNLGLAESVIDGVSSVVNKYGSIVVLEDDLVTSPYFLNYMNDGLALYENESKIACIHGYVYPLGKIDSDFFIKGGDCWGWGTWKSAWDIFEANGSKLLKELNDRKLTKEADFNNGYGFTKMLKDQVEGKNDSWAIRWYISTFLKDKLTLFPAKSFIQNIGTDESGTHSPETDVFHVEINNDYRGLKRIDVVESVEGRKKIGRFLNSMKGNIIQRLRAKIGNMYL